MSRSIANYNHGCVYIWNLAAKISKLHKIELLKVGDNHIHHTLIDHLLGIMDVFCRLLYLECLIA